jgi:hypothetical protein
VAKKKKDSIVCRRRRGSGFIVDRLICKNKEI